MRGLTNLLQGEVLQGVSPASRPGWLPVEGVGRWCADGQAAEVQPRPAGGGLSTAERSAAVRGLEGPPAQLVEAAAEATMHGLVLPPIEAGAASAPEGEGALGGPLGASSLDQRQSIFFCICCTYLSEPTVGAVDDIPGEKAEHQL